MSGSNWRLILATFVGIALLTSLHGYYQVDEATRAYDPGNHYQPARDARFSNRRVAGEPKPQAYEPYCEQPNNQGDADLCAQWSAIKSVDESNRLVRIGILITFVFGAAGVIATGIGTILVYRSLRQSDLAVHEASEANRLAKVSMRPWVDVNLLLKRAVLTSDSFELGYEAIFKNIGETIAFDVRIKIRNFFDGSAVSDRVMEFFEEYKDGIISDGNGPSMMPNETVSLGGVQLQSAPHIKWFGTGRPAVQLAVAATVFYRTPLDQEWHQTERSFLIGVKADNLMESRFIFKDARADKVDQFAITPFRSGKTT